MKMSFRKSLVFVVTLILLAGCQTLSELPSRSERVFKLENVGSVPSGKARIVFFAAPHVFGRPAGKVWNATAGELVLLGAPEDGEGLVQDLIPGEYMFMVSGENADFMPAILEPDKTYYALIQTRYGVATARFGLWPIRNGTEGDYPYVSEQVQGWLNEIEFVSPHEKYLHFWGGGTVPKPVEMYEKYLASWQEKSPEEKHRRTLLPSDGIEL